MLCEGERLDALLTLAERFAIDFGAALGDASALLGDTSSSDTVCVKLQA